MLKKGTVIFIIVLVLLLFVEIEAAQAGVLSQCKRYVTHYLTNGELIGLGFGSAFAIALTYVVFSPVEINRQKWTWKKWYQFMAKRPSFSKKRNSIARIAGVLSTSPSVNASHF